MFTEFNLTYGAVVMLLTCHLMSLTVFDTADVDTCSGWRWNCTTLPLSLRELPLPPA